MKQYKTIFLYLLLLLLALVMLFPLVWLLSTSLKPASEDVFASSIWPNSPTFKNFFKVWTSYPFDKYLLNSSIISVLTVVLNLLFCSLAAYPLARLNFWGKEIIFALIIATLMIPFQIIMIPLYILTIELGLKNTIAVSLDINVDKTMVVGHIPFKYLNFSKK